VATAFFTSTCVFDAACHKTKNLEEIIMFIFEKDGKATLCSDGRALLRAAGHAIDNQIALVQNGQLIGYGRDMHEVLNSGPTIERLRAEATMTKSMSEKPVIFAKMQHNDKQIASVENSMRDLGTLLKSMTTRNHAQAAKSGLKTGGVSSPS
jgi:hypothetical protein